MIYRREEFIEEDDKNQKFPVKQIEQLASLDGTVKRFIGRVSLALQTPMGVSTLPVTFEIPADNITEAFLAFAEHAEAAVEQSKKDLEAELQALRHRSQSRIVTAGSIPPAGPGKIKLQ